MIGNVSGEIESAGIIFGLFGGGILLYELFKDKLKKL